MSKLFLIFVIFIFIFINCLYAGRKSKNPQRAPRGDYFDFEMNKDLQENKDIRDKGKEVLVVEELGQPSKEIVVKDEVKTEKKKVGRKSYRRRFEDGGYTYVEGDSSADGMKIHWNCENRFKGCNGRIHTTAGKNPSILKIVTEHTCSGSSNKGN